MGYGVINERVRGVWAKSPSIIITMYYEWGSLVVKALNLVNWEK